MPRINYLKIDKKIISFCIIKFFFISIIFLFSNCGSTKTDITDDSANYFNISGVIEYTTIPPATINLSSQNFSSANAPQKAILNFAKVYIKINNQTYETETDNTGKFNLKIEKRLLSLEKYIEIIAVKNNLRLEKKISWNSDNNLETRVDNNSTIEANVCKILKKVYQLPENYISGLNLERIRQTKFYELFEKNYISQISNTSNFLNSDLAGLTEATALTAENFVVFASPATTDSAKSIGQFPTINLYFSKSMRTDIPFNSWFKITPDTIITTYPNIIWQNQNKNCKIQFHLSNPLPLNSKITISVDSTLLTANNQNIEPYQWSFYTGAENVINTSNYCPILETAAYHFFTYSSLFPFYKPYHTYKIRNIVETDTGVYFSYYNSTDTQIVFFKNNNGLYLLKYYDMSDKINFVKPVLLMPINTKLNESYITTINDYKYTATIKELNYDWNNEISKTITIELNVYREVTLENYTLNFTFAENYGLISFNKSPQPTRYIKSITVKPKILFPINNYKLDRRSAKIIIGYDIIKSEINNNLQISTTPDFSSNIIYSVNFTDNSITPNIQNLPAGNYYLRAASYYFNNNQYYFSDYSDTIKITITDDTFNFISTPNNLAFTNYIFKYSANVYSYMDNSKFFYKLTQSLKSVNIDNQTGYLEWQTPSIKEFDTTAFKIEAYNIITGAYTTQNFTVRLVDGNIIGSWQNSNVEYNFYSDCSFKKKNKITNTEITGVFDFINANTVMLLDSNNNLIETLTNFGINSYNNKLEFGVGGNQISLSFKERLY